jgi:hypothetical protein
MGDFGDRVLVQGEFDEVVLYSGRCFVVRWSFFEEIFQSTEMFSECLRSQVANVGELYGGLVGEVKDCRVKEEFLVVLVTRTRGTKRLGKDLHSLIVAPPEMDRDGFYARGSSRITVYLPKLNGGSSLYRQFQRGWCGYVRDKCLSTFGSLYGVLGEGEYVDGGDDLDKELLDSQLGVIRESLGDGMGSECERSMEGSNVSGVSGEISSPFEGVGMFNRRVGRLRDLIEKGDGKDLARIRALCRIYKAEAQLGRLEFKLADMGESVEDGDKELDI